LSSPRARRSRSLAHAIVQVASIEFFAVAASAYLASLAYHSVTLQAWPAPGQYVPAAIFIAMVMLAFSVGFHHFEAIQTKPRHTFLWSGIGTVCLAFSLFLTALFLTKVSEDYSRGSFLTQILCVGTAVVATRAIAYSWLQAAIAKSTVAARRVVLIGDEVLCARFSYRLRMTGIQTVDSFEFPAECELTAAAYPGSASPTVLRIRDKCRKLHPNDVIILAGQESLPNISCLTTKLSDLPINVHVVPRDAIELLATSRIVEFGNVVAIQVSGPPLSTFDLCLKRGFDIVASIGGLIIASPLMLITAICIKLDSPGPVFFRQMRQGYNNQTIKINKFRSMTTLEDGGAFRQVSRNDSRVTRVGRVLRATNIDELPQLINVLLGDMSIVGPRPHATAHNEMFQERIPPFARRHNVKPGITGWAQVNGCRGETATLEKMQERVEYDLYYIDNWSFLLDLKILIMTLFSRKSYLNAY
jgi:Undecaprenyl-phosphate glucose phosphotransferase